MLLDYYGDYAKSIGVTSIILNSGKKRTKAHEFYEKNGFFQRFLLLWERNHLKGLVLQTMRAAT